MSEPLAHKIEDLRAIGARLFELLNEVASDAGLALSTPRRHSDFSLAEVAQGILKQRRVRSEHLPLELFSEPAWDILLDLFIAVVEQQQISVSSACLATVVPATTALRWLDILQHQGLVERYPSADDKRVTFVRLTNAGRNVLRGYLSAVCSQPATTRAATSRHPQHAKPRLASNG